MYCQPQISRALNSVFCGSSPFTKCCPLMLASQFLGSYKVLKADVHSVQGSSQLLLAPGMPCLARLLCVSRLSPPVSCCELLHQIKLALNVNLENGQTVMPYCQHTVQGVESARDSLGSYCCPSPVSISRCCGFVYRSVTLSGPPASLGWRAGGPAWCPHPQHQEPRRQFTHPL